VRELPNVEVRANITLSVYNYSLVEEVIAMLCESWPGIVTFSTPRIDYLRESSIPKNLRQDVIGSLEQAVNHLESTKIESGQKSNAINAITSIINNLKQVPYNLVNHQQLLDFILKMDRVKGVNAEDYSAFLGQLIQQKVS
jgi:hypothetical protein